LVVVGMHDCRAELLGQARGRVVEIGAGTGLNVEHYSREADEVILTEPVPAMYRRACRRAADQGAMLVLCTVAEVEPVLAEIVRVLRPGGRLLFCEHVRAIDPKLARRQSRYARPCGGW
jgi:ubiquinone/menaquinone biosynthesis C-methylase UbiE